MICGSQSGQKNAMLFVAPALVLGALVLVYAAGVGLVHSGSHTYLLPTLPELRIQIPWLNKTAADDEQAAQPVPLPTYSENPKHPPCGEGPRKDTKGRTVSPQPRDGQGALQNSAEFGSTGRTRISVDPRTGEYIRLRRDSFNPENGASNWHGFTERSWKNLSPQEQKALIDAGLTNKKGDPIDANGNVIDPDLPPC
jgi:hypothetical protein